MFELHNTEVSQEEGGQKEGSWMEEGTKVGEGESEGSSSTQFSTL